MPPQGPDSLSNNEYQETSRRDRLTLETLTCSDQKVNDENWLVGYLFKMKIKESLFYK